MNWDELISEDFIGMSDGEIRDWEDSVHVVEDDETGRLKEK